MEFNDNELLVISAALRQYERFHRVTSLSPCIALADLADRIAQRVEGHIEPDGIVPFRGSREDFHSDL